MTNEDLGPFVRAALDARRDAAMVLDLHGRLVCANEVMSASLPGKPADWKGSIVRLWSEHASAKPIVIDGRQVGVLMTVAADQGGGTLEERERVAIFEALRATGWRPGAASRRLGMSRTTLWRRLKRYESRDMRSAPTTVPTP
jgi:transcriptional regulator of acetoin/glycerol metabolism